MISRKTYFAALLGCAILTACDHSSDKTDSAQATGTFGTPVASNETSTASTPTNDAAATQPSANTITTSSDTNTTPVPDPTTTAAIADLDSRVQALESTIAALKANPAITQAQLDQIGTLQLALASVKADLDAAQATLKDSASVDQLNAEAATLQAAIEQKSDASTVAALTAEVTDLQAALAAQTQSADTAIAALTQRVAALETTTSALNSQLAQALKADDQDLADYVNTMRGSHSNGDFSRGNTFPATAMPFGFNMWTPINRNDSNWFYQFYEDEASTQLLKTIYGFAVVHEPSPWIGNRQSLVIMPVRSDSSGNPVTPIGSRGETFQRQNETAHAHYYSLTFDNGTRTEITPTDHAAYFRFTAPAGQSTLSLALDRMSGSSSIAFDKTANAISGTTNHGSPAMYYYAVFDAPVVSNASSTSLPYWLKFNTADGGSKVVGMRIATSFLSVAQAKSNLDQEIGSKSFDDVEALAKAAWNDKLNIAQVDGATPDQKVILYSNMYRSFLYPNSAWENVAGTPTYMSPYTSPPQQKAGKIWVNNGFWDTYRANWPLYTLLFPNHAGEMMDGFVNGYKDGGWVTRWSGPGYNDSMVATSSDIIFADAYLKGVRNFDVDAAYQSMLKDATVYSSDGSRGRKGMDQTPFYGYSVMGSESVSWSLEAYLNDFGIGEMAKALGKNDDAAYMANEALGYAKIFDGTSTGTWAGGWFRGKYTDGTYYFDGYSYIDPTTWGYDFTEGNAWSYAFLAPQDGQGLANLYGGRDKLKAKLDAFFTAPTPVAAGSYGRIIHEEKEANQVNVLAGVGQYEHNNQPVHHSIYMYNYAGSPSSGQKYLRDVMDKLYFSGFDAKGNSTGDGYIGDEDNGEMSSWYLFSAMGFYPVSMGRPIYAIGAPYFPEMTVRVEDTDGNVHKIVINAPSVSSVNRYVQSVSLNGRPLTRNYLNHSEIAVGATLDFIMGPNPSSWGTGVNDVPPSITQGDAKPTPLVSLLPGGSYSVSASNTTGAAALTDRTSSTSWSSPAGTAAFVEADKNAPLATDSVSFYTLTSGVTPAANPTGWTLKGSNDGTTWVTLDTRTNQTFAWQQQVRPFALAKPASYTQYRLEFTGTAAVTVAEFELYGTPGAAPASTAVPVPAAPASTNSSTAG